MDDRHPNSIDPQVKRRRDKDNPYTIFTTGIETNSPRYYLSFRDGCGVQHCMEIGRELYEALNQFELEDISFMNEVDRHYERSEQTEESLNKRAVRRNNSVEEIVYRHMENERLYEAIGKLPETQRRRLTLYYFGAFTYEQIAKQEGCTIMPVKRSIDSAIKKLKNFMK